ncbi:MAG: ribonuclease Z [Firmicutes bacterium HGW-Firmicutes-7]|nr:MAG: ribonuclease Z [Firmicutes bacterium HGW-Firmicutes-7]
MLDVCLLGTGGMMPLPYRWLTALMVRYNGSNMLIDCGEGTQITIKQQGWSFKAIDLICFTHYHGDHISGLPGLLLTIGNSNRTEPLTLVGPKGLERVVNGLRVIAPELPYTINFIEMNEPYENFNSGQYNIEAYRVKHNILCYAYNINIKRQGKFDIDKAKANNIPLKCWSPLQKGNTIELEGQLLTPDMVLGDSRKGLKISYCTDSRPVKQIETYAKDADLFVCEGMYGEETEETKASAYKHMTFEEAATLAKNANVSELWLTHFSPSLVYPKDYLHVAKKIFQNTVVGKDRMTTTFKFEDDTTEDQ